MFKKKTNYFIIVLILTVFSFYSCQTILKSYLGIKNPQLVLSNTERLEYYKPYIENSDSNFELFVVKELDTLLNTFNKHQNYPLIFIQDNTTEHEDVYLLNCFDDVSYFVEDINKGDFEDIARDEKAELSDLKSYLDINAEVTYSNYIDKNRKWNVYVVSATFLGKKLRKRMLPVMKLQDLNKVSVLDLSVNEG